MMERQNSDGFLEMDEEGARPDPSTSIFRRFIREEERPASRPDWALSATTTEEMLLIEEEEEEGGAQEENDFEEEFVNSLTFSEGMFETTGEFENIREDSDHECDQVGSLMSLQGTMSMSIPNRTMKEDEWALLNSMVDSRPRSYFGRTTAGTTFKDSPEYESFTRLDSIQKMKTDQEKGSNALSSLLAERTRTSHNEENTYSAFSGNSSQTPFSPITTSTGTFTPTETEKKESILVRKESALLSPKRSIPIETTRLQKLISQVYNDANQYSEELYSVSLSQDSTLEGDLVRLEKILDMLQDISSNSECECWQSLTPGKRCLLFLSGSLRYYGIHEALLEFISMNEFQEQVHTLSLKVACIITELGICKALSVPKPFQFILSMDVLGICLSHYDRLSKPVCPDVVECLFQLMIPEQTPRSGFLRRYFSQDIRRPHLFPHIIQLLTRITPAQRCQALETIASLLSVNQTNIQSITALRNWTHWIVPILLPHPSTIPDQTQFAYSTEESEIAFRYQINILSKALSFRLHNSGSSSLFRAELEAVVGQLGKSREAGGDDLCRVLFYSLLHRMQNVSHRDVELLQGKSRFPFNQIVVLQTVVEGVLFPKGGAFSVDEDMEIPDRFLVAKALEYAQHKIDSSFFERLPIEFYRSSEMKKVLRKLQRDSELLQSLLNFIGLVTGSVRSSDSEQLDEAALNLTKILGKSKRISRLYKRSRSMQTELLKFAREYRRSRRKQKGNGTRRKQFVRTSTAMAAREFVKSK